MHARRDQVCSAIAGADLLRRGIGGRKEAGGRKRGVEIRGLAKAAVEDRVGGVERDRVSANAGAIGRDWNGLEGQLRERDTREATASSLERKTRYDSVWKACECNRRYD